MKFIVVAALFLIQLGFANDFDFLKKDIEKDHKKPKLDRCEKIGQIAGAMTMLKWASRQADYEEHKVTSKEDELKTLMYVFSDEYKSVGLTMDEVKEMATTIRDYTIVGRMEMDFISFSTYYQTSCQLKKGKKIPTALKDIYLDMNDCWVRESKTGVRAEKCIEALVAGGEGSVDENVKLLIEGKNMLAKKQPKVAIDNYFNRIIQHCTKKDAVDSYICADATYHIGSAYVELKELNRAKKWIRKAIKLLPKASTYVTELAFIYQLEKDLSKALELYKSAEEIAQKDLGYQDNQRGLSRALRGEGFIFIEMGQLKKAKEYFNKALKINPNDEGALHELKYIESLEIAKSK